MYPRIPVPTGSAWVAAILWLAPAPVLAQRPIENVPVCVQPGQQQFPQIVSDGSGGAFVAWRDVRPEVGATMRTQRIRSDEVLWNAEGLVTGRTEFVLQPPAILPDDAGGLFFAWPRMPANLYGNRLDDRGSQLWGSFGVPLANGFAMTHVRLVADGSGGVIAVWSDERNGSNDVFAQRFDAQGTPQWAFNGVEVSVAESHQLPIGAIPDHAGGVLVLWWDTRNRHVSLRAQRIDASGALLWASEGIQISGTLPFESRNWVEDGAGGAIVLWQEVRTTEDQLVESDLVAQHFRADGSFGWPGEGVRIATVPGYSHHMSAVSDEAGGAIVVWDDGEAQLTAQRVKADGTLAWARQPVLATSASAGPGAVVISDQASGAIVVWPSDGDVLAQRITAGGVVAWRRAGVPLADAKGLKFHISACTDGDGGAYVCWSENADDLYAQRVLGNGQAYVRNNGVTAARLPEGRNGDLDGGAIRFSLSEPAAFALRIYDATGRHVGTIPTTRFAAGENQVSWREAGEALRPGVYFYRPDTNTQMKGGKFVVLTR